jgi:hypothetical protein
MAIRAYGMDFQTRVPLPGLAGSKYDWELDHQKIISNGYRSPKRMQYLLLDEVVVITKEICVHTFTMGDVEDPDLYAAEPLYQWQQSPQGDWVMKNAIEPPVWHRMADNMNYGYKYSITATFIEKKLTEYYLRFG